MINLKKDFARDLTGKVQPLVRISICSCNIGLLCPEKGEETEQKLTIRADGRCRLTRWTYWECEDYPKHEYFRITPDAAKKIFDAVDSALEAAPLDAFQTILDVGGWHLTLTYENGQELTWDSSFCGDLHLPSGEALSPFLRKCLGKKDLLLFHPLWDESSQEI